ncbi:MAG: 6,7-dimethyl-8-ribityllumazine synthase [Bacteroidales bacterium]|nr:6,7-dimethyl-8-ribityllumazine synthase [Bacteroidales bacterium]
MSTELRNNDTALHTLPKLNSLRVGIAVAEWNSHITEALLAGALELFAREGYSEIEVHHVPGTVELTFAASRMARSGRYDAVIVFGCVIRGGTPHFDYVCDSITQGVATLNAEGRVPVIFGVLTTDDEQQAIDRAGGALGNKGTEAAEAAIKMCDFSCKFQ